MAETTRRRIHVSGSRPDIKVPFVEIDLHDSPGGQSNPPLRRYDTAGGRRVLVLSPSVLMKKLERMV